MTSESGSALNPRNRNTFECVDVDAESVPGSELAADGTRFFFTEARTCQNNVDCLPPYTEGNELACVVCTK